MTLDEGIHFVRHDEYLADPAPEPSLNASTAKILIENSPQHAYAIHPRLGGGRALGDADVSEEADIGTAAHEMFLLGSDAVAVLDVDSFRTNAAKQARDEARAAGKLPLKKANHQAVLRIVDALEEFRGRTGAFTKGQPERAMIWRDGPIWCRGKIDWLPDDPGAAPWDLKTTGGRATIDGFTRVAFDKRYEVQDAFYARGLELLRDEEPDLMRFCVVEQKPPYGIRVFGMSPAARELGQAEAAEARDLWTACIASGEWPTYPEVTEMLEPPLYKLRAWEYRMMSARPAALTWEQKNAVREGHAARFIQVGQFGG